MRKIRTSVMSPLYPTGIVSGVTVTVFPVRVLTTAEGRSKGRPAPRVFPLRHGDTYSGVWPGSVAVPPSSTSGASGSGIPSSYHAPETSSRPRRNQRGVADPRLSIAGHVGDLVHVTVDHAAYKAHVLGALQPRLRFAVEFLPVAVYGLIVPSTARPSVTLRPLPCP